MDLQVRGAASGGAALEALVDAAAGILAADSLEGTLGRIAHHLGALLPYDDLTVYEVDPDGVTLNPVFAVGDWVEEVLADPSSIHEGVTGWVVRQRRTRNVPNSRREPLVSLVEGTDDTAEAFVSVPLLAAERVVGALNVYRSDADLPFSEEEVELVERFATMAALAYDSARQKDVLRRQVRTDGLTGLLNHRACQEELAGALAAAAGGRVGVVVLDLDHFKRVNDAYGHAEGDRVLTAAAAKLRAVVREGDVVGRLGGEEFVLILPGVGPAGAQDAAERARAALEEVSVHGRPLGSSAGVAAAPDDGTAAPRLLEHADAALYWAKRSGRGQTRRFGRGAPLPLSEATERAEVEALLARGTDAIEPVFQPVLELATGRSGGWEALARFPGEHGRTPDEWFATAHRLGLGAELEALALRAALAVPGRPAGTFLALNVSPHALLSAPVRAALPADLGDVVIELTEHEVFGEAELEAELAALRARGARIALDDAGAGYAGLQQLIRVAPDILKLDRALVDGAHGDPSRRALLEALISFAANTGAAVCGEGVEELADLRTLAELDVTYAQGYALARPGPDWPAAAPAAAAAVAADIVAGMRLAPLARTTSGALSRALGDLADEVAGLDRVDRLAAANSRAAALLGADDISLLHLHGDTMRLLSARPRYGVEDTWSLAAYPATAQVVARRVPAQVVAGDPHGDAAELAELDAIGMGTLLMLPVVFGGRVLAIMEIYRVRAQAFTAAEIDRARVVAQQFGAALDRMLA